MRRLVQLALDLFDAPADVAPADAEYQQKMPPAPAPRAPEAIKTVAKQGPAKPPVKPLLPPASFRHPRANREVLLGDAVVGYALQRARRRTIGFTVGADGLSVRAPGWVTLAGVDAALREKSGWILRKLDEARERQQRLEHARIDWRDGAVLPYLGAQMRIVLDPAQSAAGLLCEAAGEGGAPELHIGLPASAKPEQIRDAAQAWLMRTARLHFSTRLDHFAPLLGVRWTRLRLSSARTRWGSARIDGSINLNWRLLHYPASVIDYVVAHELAHLRVMDHSPRFWETVRSVVPDYAALRRQLYDEPAPRWD